MDRRKEGKGKRNRYFGRTADRTHPYNVKPKPMRGGTRL
jgi:hypothetical protein